VGARKGTQPKNTPRGRKRGATNLISRHAREAFELAFVGLGGVPALITWAQRNRASFYKLYARLAAPAAITNVAVQVNEQVVVTDAATAATAYARLMRRELEPANITFDAASGERTTLPVPISSAPAPTAAPSGELRPGKLSERQAMGDST
jgi:hypothetical protein